MIKVTPIGLGTNHNHIPTGEIDTDVDSFVRSNALHQDIGNVYRAFGEQTDVFIIEALPPKKQLNVRLPAAAFTQLETIQNESGMTQVQVIILALEVLTRSRNVKRRNSPRKTK